MNSHKAMPDPGRSAGTAFGGLTEREPSIFLRGATPLLLFCLLTVISGPPVRAAQKGNSQVELLIARNQVNDPYFRHSVVLMLPETETQLVVGLIINRPTRLTLSRLFPDSPELKARTEHAYFGGPVDVRTPSVVFRSEKKPDNAVRLFGNVYLTFDSDLISSAFKSSKPGSGPRMFLGRAQWAPGQLENEIRLGGWYRIKAEGDLVFSPDPDNLWQTLHARAAPSKYIRFRPLSPGSQPSTLKVAVM
jgi:putative transcriptional regulator